MDVRELRVGNILNKEDIIVTIDARSIFDIWDKSDKYKAIRLTEKWILKLGFEKRSFWFHPAMGTIYLKESPSGFYWVKSIEGAKITSVQYVHQLQNLYYVITGEELTIKESTLA